LAGSFAIDLVHRTEAWRKWTHLHPKSADFIKQAVDFIEFFPAQFVIVLKFGSIGAGLRSGVAVFCTKLSTRSVGPRLPLCDAVLRRTDE
jgi:hypothetical protein